MRRRFKWFTISTFRSFSFIVIYFSRGKPAYFIDKSAYFDARSRINPHVIQNHPSEWVVRLLQMRF